MLGKVAKAIQTVGARRVHHVVPNFQKILASEQPVTVYTSTEYKGEQRFLSLELYEGRDGIQSWAAFREGVNDFDHVNAGLSN